MKEKDTLKWIYKRCNRGFWNMALLVFLSSWSAVCITGFAMLSKNVIDSAQQGDKDALIRHSLFLVLLIASQMIARVAYSILVAVNCGRAEMNLKTFVFSNVLRNKYDFTTKFHSGEIMTRLTSDVNVVSQNAVELVPRALMYGVRILSAAIALIIIDRRFALIFICCGVLIGLFAAILRKPLKKFHNEVQQKDENVRSYLQEMTENLFAVKIFRIYDKVLARAETVQKKLYKSQLKRSVFSTGVNIGFSLLFGVSFACAVAYGSNGILKGTMSFGSVVALIQLVNQIGGPIAGVTGIIPSFFAMTTSAQRLMEISVDNKSKKETIVRYNDFEEIKGEGIKFAYDDEIVLNNFDFSIKKGEFIGVQGQSGTGKTTLLKLITGLYTPSDGKITIETTNGSLPCDNVKGLFSFVPQGNMLFSGSIRENLTLLSKNATDDEIENALKIACADFVYSLDGKLDFVLAENGGGISEGQAQRIAIARAILSKNKFILMDEATSALDSETEEKLLDNLKSLKEYTILFISHKENVIKNCDRIISITKSNKM